MISEAWKTVDSTVVQKCFRKSGILDKEFNVVQEFNLHEDPFSNLDDEQSASAQEGNDPELLNLIQETCGGNDFSFEDSGPDKVPTCFDLEDETWQERFFEELVPNGSKWHCAGDEEQNDSDVDGDDDQLIEPQNSIKTYSEALSTSRI